MSITTPERREAVLHDELPTTRAERTKPSSAFAGWRESTFTRVKELEALGAWVMANRTHEQTELFEDKFREHLHTAKQAAEVSARTSRRLFRPMGDSSLAQRAISNLNAAEAQLLLHAPPGYLLGQLPSILHAVRSQLVASDPRRKELERLALKLGAYYSDEIEPSETKELNTVDKQKLIDVQRGRIVSALREASSLALREQLRVHSFQNVVVAMTLLLVFLALGIAITGWLRPTLIPICFAPETSGYVTVVCPTAQSEAFRISSEPTQLSDPLPRNINKVVLETAARQDLLVVELVGLTAASVAAAAAIRRITGSPEWQGLSIALAVLKLPAGAIAAFLGLLLVRGQFVPGLIALTTSAQILAWALVFGYAQELFTRSADGRAAMLMGSTRAWSYSAAGPDGFTRLKEGATVRADSENRCGIRAIYQYPDLRYGADDLGLYLHSINSTWLLCYELSSLREATSSGTTAESQGILEVGQPRVPQTLSASPRLTVLNLRIQSPMDFSLIADGTMTAATAYAIHLLVQVVRNPRAVGSWLPQVLLGWRTAMNEVEQARLERTDPTSYRMGDASWRRMQAISNELIVAAEENLSKLRPDEISSFGAGDLPDELRDSDDQGEGTTSPAG